ncbi:hypothetical protein GCM10027578_08630 [Spirosoma luteolum]
MKLYLSLLLVLASSAGVSAQWGRTFIDSVATLPDTSQIKASRRFADTQIDLGRFATADSVLQSALTTAERTHQPLLIAGVYRSLGYLAKSQSQFPRALTHFQRSLRLYQQAGRHDQVSTLLLMLGQVYERAGDEVNRGKYYEASLAEARRHHLPVAEADALSNLANYKDSQHRRAESLAYSQQALALYKKLQDHFAYYVLLLNRAITLKNAGRLAESEQAFRACLAWAKQAHEPSIETFVYINLPNTLLLLGRPAEAAAYARQALDRAAHSGDPYPIRRESYDILTRAAEQQGNYRQALQYHRQYVVWRDSMFTAEKSRQLIDVETRYQTVQKQARIAQLRADNQQQQRQLWVGMAGIMVLLVLLAISSWQYRLIRKTNAQLAETNRVISANNVQIREQSTQLTTLMHELHHRVKNNLSMISSLLRLQSSQLQDKGAAQAVLDGQHRVEAMTLIHHRLYQTDNVSRIGVQDYITDLTHELMQSFGFGADRLALDLRVTPHEIDVDIAIPIGLILNELLTNAFKYAFQGVDKPALLVSLMPPTDGSASPFDRGPLVLIVQDNGPGVDPERWRSQPRSFGHRLIVSLSRQLGGTLSVDGSQGTRVELRIPADRVWQRYAGTAQAA